MTEITPLITAEEGFPALERLALSAKRELFLSFRICDPATRLRSDEARDFGLKTWADMLAHLSERGVRLSIILTDFDPLFTADLHETAHAHAETFARRLGPSARILCAPHGQYAGRLWVWAFAGKITKKQARLKTGSRRLTRIQQKILERRPFLRPVTLHQKFMVADGARAVIGGLDVNERRYDTPDHDRAAEDTWHDVALEVSGEVCADLRAHFIDTWNTALCADCTPYLGEAAPMPQQSPGAHPLPRLLRTISSPRLLPHAISPARHICEHEEALIAAFGRAKRSIYIETQFFRHWPLARALARAARDNPDLEVILLMPTAPERILFNGDDGIDARHAQALQLRCLNHIRKAFGARLAVVCPAKPEPAAPTETGTLHGAGVVYVHAKVTLIDEDWGLVGSANLNGRSMRWDTEAGLAFDDPQVISKLRERLAEIWLGEQVDGADITRAATWTDIAEANAKTPPAERASFLLPYPTEKTRRFARFVPILPTDMF